MQWLDKLVQKTRCYQNLFREVSFSRNEYEKLQFMYDEQHKTILNIREDIDKLTNQIKHNKTNARKIYKLTKDKDIRKLCNKILKGEK